MSLKYLTDIDLNKNELQNVKVHILPTDPTVAAGDEALLWYNSSSHILKYFNGTTVIPLGLITIDSALSSTSENAVQNKVINSALGNKVDKVSGKGLSANDFTTALLNKLNGIASGAEVNVQADWNVTDSSSDAFIKNKPTIPAGVSPATTAPKMDGTAAVGTSAKFAREDHVHPSDTSKVDKETGKGLSTNDYTDYDQAAVAAMAGNLPDMYVDGVYMAGAEDPGESTPVGLESLQSFTHYGVCSSSASATAKTVSLEGVNRVALEPGFWCAVKFSNTNTGAVGSLTLNVNSSGAKAIKYRNGNLPSAGTLAANRIYLFVYDGTYWQIVGDLDTNNTYTAASATPKNIGTAAVGSSAKYAREDHVHAIDLATGDSNGQVKIAGTNVSVKGLGSAAYMAAGSAGGVATLDTEGKVPSSQLPSYVDDVVEYSSQSAFPATGETGKIYVATDTNKTYRWSGSAYVEISASLALGETSSTAYRGDRGKTAYDHAAAKGSAFSSGLYKITTNAQGHVTGATAVAKSDITALGIPAQDTTYEVATQSANGLMSKDDKSKLDGIEAGAEVNPTYTAFTGKPTANQTPGFGSTFTISQIKQSADGQVSGTDRTVKIPDTVATQSAAGLMSALDKAYLDALVTNGVYRERFENSALTSSGGVCTWTIESFIQYPTIVLYEISSGKQVMAEIIKGSTPDQSTFTYSHQIKIISGSNIAAGTYEAIVVG